MKLAFTLSCSLTTDKVANIIRNNSYKLTKNPTKNYLDIYEQAVGFTEYSRIGNSNFKNNFGKIIEDIYDTSEYFTKFDNKNTKYLDTNCDGFNDTTLFESKMRWNTMKSSMAVEEIKSKVLNSVMQEKDFNLLVLIDDPSKNANGRNIPLHEGQSLKKLKDIRYYNPDKHRYISGDEIYKLLWPNEWEDVKATILKELYNISGRL